MTIWEAMTEDAHEYITNNFCGKDSSIDEVEEFLQSEYVYDLYNFGVFGKNNEMILAVGYDDAVIINLKTFEVVKKLKLR